MTSNFQFLSQYWPDLSQIGRTAELYIYSDPNTCIYNLGLLAERVVSEIFTYEKISVSENSSQSSKIKILERESLLPKNINDILFALCKARNDAVHTVLNSFEKAQTLLRMTFNLASWFMEVYGDWEYTPTEFIQPADYSDQEYYKDLLHTQEEKVSEFSEQITEIRTPASNASSEERAKKAFDVSENLKLTEAEKQYLISEQIRMEISITPVINYALQQNRVPAVQAITVVNNSPNAIENVELRITVTPELCLPFTKHIDYIPESSTYDVKDVQLVLNAEFLAGLTEKITGLLHVSLAVEEQIVCSDNIEITALAFDEWHGYGFYPELLAAFVTPNHPEISKLNARAAELLEKWTSDPSLDAYQTKDPNRVLKQAAAIYGALQEQNIIYSVPPASFERIGQRVRLCDAIIQQKMGTCLDLTLLYASCLEAVGLHPLLILKKDHAFAGVWLEDLSFPESVQDDASLITKRLAEGINEVAVVECTLFVAGKHATFDDAQVAAEHSMTGTEPIEYIIDVNRARLSGVSPLPLRVQTDSGWRIERDARSESELTSAPKDVSGVIPLTNVKENPVSKKVQWERKLLDLGLRNALINMHFSKTMVPILASSLDELEDALSGGSEFAVMARPADWHLSGDSVNFETIYDLGPYKNIIKSEFQNKRLRSILGEADLTRTIKGLYRSSKTSLEENGANTLYLSLGLLRWYETQRSTKARYAPVVLLPIEIIRKSANQGYKIRLRDEDPQMNITMLEKMKQDFGIVVNGLDPLPQDDHGTDIRKVFTILRKSVMGQARWDVLESAYLGIFSFSQFVMWNDIRNRSDDLLRNKIVRSLMDGKLAWDAEPMNIGDRVPEEPVLLPVPADASQLYAIEAASKGESFVLHGPPGTGKSQTITALIANALAQGKTVLFVAEKMAALEVVQKRLATIGLAPFCLELHSNKSKKKDVLEQLRVVTEVTKTETAEAYASKSAQITKTRTELDEYATSLHKKLDCGMSLYELINGYEENILAPDLSPFPTELVEHLTGDILEQQNTLVERMIAAAKSVGHPHNHPLKDVGCTQYTQQLHTELKEAVTSYESVLTVLCEACDDLTASIHYTFPNQYSDLEKLSLISEELAAWSAFPRAWATSENIPQYLDAVRKMAKQYIQVNEMRNALKNTWQPEFFALNGAEVKERIESVSNKWLIPKAIEFGEIAQNIIQYRNEAPVERSLISFSPMLTVLYSACKELISAVGLLCPENETDLADIFDISRELALWEAFPRTWGIVPDIGSYLRSVQDMVQHFIQADDIFNKLTENWQPEILALDGTALLEEYNSASKKMFIPKALQLRKLIKRISIYSKASIDKNTIGKQLAEIVLYQSEKAKAEEAFKLYGDELGTLFTGESTDWQRIYDCTKSAKISAITLKDITGSDEFRIKYCGVKRVFEIVDNFNEAWQSFIPVKEDIRSLCDLTNPNTQIGWIALQISKLEQYQDQKAEADTEFNIYGKGLDGLFNEDLTNWDQIIEYSQQAEINAERLKTITGSNTICRQYAGVKEITEKCGTLNVMWVKLLSAKERVYSLLHLTSSSEEDNWLKQQLKMCEDISNHMDELKEWITWKSIAAEAIGLGLQPVVDAYQDGMSHDVIQSAYRKGIYRALAAYTIDHNTTLNTFSGAVFNEKIEQFKRIDKELMELTRKEIFCRLAAQIPNFSKEVAQSSELGILQRAIRSGGRGISIRKLIERIPNLLPRLCPCMLMSPISAAQYLDPKRALFDIVVFDEASQLPTCKAVGALARGKNAVIVGDPKQMPPTTFFMTNTIDEENLDIEDLDSILDDCLALNMPQTHLLWHYRSRHESLIAFSNNQFYENKLYTFPSVNDRESKVRLIHIDGCFDRGKTRQNRAEAEAIIEEIKRRCHDKVCSKQSVGVVTFNISQQNLIDDLLAEACNTDPELEKWVYESEEPLFIKNLENVQGDERDVILFSVGYGPDKEGKVYMNFGPLNRDGGWRRLNVAVSRARCEMVVFSTLTPDQINLSKSSADGVVALKAFLEYAANHKLPVNENTSKQYHARKGDVAAAICTVLKEHGYKTDRIVGHSKYRVDIGVIDPKVPEKYLLGILLDGLNYRRSKTTRDREIAQVSVLNGLGWNILRIWTMDWWDNRRKEIDRILSTLEEIQEAPLEAESPTVAEEPAIEVVKSAPAEVSRIASANTKSTRIISKVKTYVAAKLQMDYVSPDDFLLPNYTEEIQSKVATVINCEAPISEGMLTRRVVQSFGIARSGSRIQARMDGIYPSMGLKYTIQSGQKFYWKNDQNPDEYSDFRACGQDLNKRDAKDVPIQEAVNAICFVLYEQISLSQEDLVREAAKLLGYTRLGSIVVASFRTAIHYAHEKLRIETGTNGNWILCPNEESYVNKLAANVTYISI
jgi:very-short-patch-repair endonuclease